MRLYKRSDTWWIEYHKDGKQIRISTHTHDKASAKAIKHELESARLQSRKTSRTRSVEAIVEAVLAEFDITLEEFFKKHGVANLRTKSENESAENKKLLGTPLASAWSIYEETARSCALLPSSPTTLYKRKNAVLRFVEWVQDNRAAVETIEAVTGSIAAGYASALAASGKATKTRKNLIGDLGTVWKILGKHVDGISNPWANLAPRDTDGKRGEAFTREEEEKVFAAAAKVGKNWLQVCKIMRHTGLRYGDVAMMTWSEVDFEKNVFRVVPHKTAGKKIVVTPAMIPEVRELLETLPHNGEYLFPLHAELYGNRGRASREALNFREVLNVAGISREGLTIHSWRHTAASRLADAGVDKETRKRILGHTEDLTADRYDHTEHIEENRAAQLAAAK